MVSFRGASADGVAVLTTEVEAAVAASSGQAETIAAELISVAGALRSEGGFRRFVTDASVPTEAKAGLVSQVFADKLSESGAKLLTSAVSRRWTAARDLADALEHLSVVATVRSAPNDADRLADELFGFGQVVKDNPELREALSDPARSLDDKTALVDQLLAGKALPATMALAKQSLSSSFRTVNAALSEYQKVAAEVRDQGVATVRVARPMSDSEHDRLGKALARQYGRDVHLNVLVDPDVIGGVRVEIGDDVIDGTVAARLDDASRKIAG